MNETLDRLVIEQEKLDAEEAIRRKLQLIAKQLEELAFKIRHSANDVAADRLWPFLNDVIQVQDDVLTTLSRLGLHDLIRLAVAYQDALTKLETLGPGEKSSS